MLDKTCGEIVFKASHFAYKCLFCALTSKTLRGFKLHLYKEHIEQLLDEQQTAAKQQVATEADPLEESCNSFDAELDSEKFESNSNPLQRSSSEEESYCGDNNELIETHEAVHFWLRKHPVMFALIEEYKKACPLWDITLKSFSKKRPKICDQIALSINSKFCLQLKGTEVSVYLKKLRLAYYHEGALLNDSKSYTPQWYYEHLHFLGTRSAPRARNPPLDNKPLTIATALPVPQLSHEQNCALIELYSRCSDSWDMQNMHCRLRHVRQQANETLLQLCRSELQLKLEPAQLKRYVFRIRFAYTQEKTRRLNCETAGRQFVPTCRYYKQIEFLEQHVGPFKCEICAEVFNGVDCFKMHRAKHDGSLPFECPICQRGFSQSGNCTIHLRRHTQDYQVVCQYCSKRFATTSDMHVHQRTHTGEKPYCCDVCGQRFRSLSLFDRHKRRHEKRPKAKCHICGKCFFEQSVLKDHVKAHLNVRDKVCNICQKTFTNAKILRQHKEIHAEHKRYKCKICAKSFAQYAGLSGHMKSHGGIKVNRTSSSITKIPNENKKDYQDELD